MKTSSAARRLARIRVIMVCVAIAAIAGIEFRISESLANRFGQAAATQTQTAQVPNVTIGDLMAAAR